MKRYEEAKMEILDLRGRDIITDSNEIDIPGSEDPGEAFK